MWKIKLEEIIEEKNLYGEQINSGASQVELAKFKISIQRGNVHHSRCLIPSVCGLFSLPSC